MKINPRQHYDFSSYQHKLKIRVPLVLDEHQITYISIFALEPEGVTSQSLCRVQISASGPLILKETGVGDELHQIVREIFVPGNDTLHIQSPHEYDYPSGMEGNCVAQSNLIARKLDRAGNREYVSDSVSVTMYIRRSLINVFKAIWSSANGIAKNLGGSVLITSFIAVLVHLFGQDVASLVPHLLGLFVFLILFVSFLNSWKTRNNYINERLQENREYQKLLRGESDG